MRARTLLVPSLIAFPLIACHATQTDSAGTLPIAQANPTEASLAAPAVVPGTNWVAAKAPTAPVAASGLANANETLAERFYQDDFLQEEAGKQELLRDRARKLAAKYVDDARRDLDRADVEAALANFATALSVDPANEEARLGFLQAKALAGDENTSARQLLQDQVSFELVRQAEARIQAAELVSKGDDARRQGDFEAAIQSYRRAEVVLLTHPLIEDDDLDRQVIERKIEGARSQSSEAESAAALEARDLAEDERLRACLLYTSPSPRDS